MEEEKNKTNIEINCGEAIILILLVIIAINTC